MVVPVAGRSLAAVAGGWVTRWTDRIVDWAFIVAVGAGDDYLRRERVRVAQGVTLLIVQFLAWLGSSFIGFSLLLWPFAAGGITQALTCGAGMPWSCQPGRGCALGIWRYEPASGRSEVAPAGRGVSVIIAVPRRVRGCGVAVVRRARCW